MMTTVQLPKLPITSDFSQENPVVQSWTNFFLDITQQQRIFDSILSSSAPAHEQALTVGSYWSEFSRIVPNLLIQAAAKLKDPRKQPYFVRIAHEELGNGNSEEIHADLFNSALAVTGVSDQEREHFIHDKLQRRSLDFIVDGVMKASSDSEVIGIGLGLEAPAVENIETLFSSLGASEQIEHTAFFRIHRVVEAEHIRLNIENFLRYCHSDEEKKEFLKGFFKALKFWKLFWSDAARSMVKIPQKAVESCG